MTQPAANDYDSSTSLKPVTNLVRVRLLVAIPVMIVLLLTTMVGVLYQITDWQLAERLTSANTEAELKYSRMLVFWLITLFIFDITGAVAGYLIARSISRPLEKMMVASRRVAGGDFTFKAPAESQDEVGLLGHSFNAMIDSLNRFFSSRNRFILESFTGGLITADLNGTITAINSAAETMLDLNQMDAQGKPVARAFPSERLGALTAAVEEILWSGGTADHRSITITSTEGKTTHLNVRFSFMRDKSDRPFGLIINMRDMSELQKFYEQMSRADRLATVGTFATGLAHEVRNPLGAIKATAQLLAEDLADDERMCGFTQIIVDETNRLDQLVREVQELSQSATPLVSADLNDVVRECLRVALSSGKAPGSDQLTINESYDAALPALPLSPGKIRQALLNVLINALQAAPPAGSICVTTALRPDEPLPAVISVVNKGTSIAPDDLAKVFEPFFTTKDQGTGLGLAITAQIIRHHGGEIHLMNSDDGVALIISLPLKSPELDVAF